MKTRFGIYISGDVNNPFAIGDIDTMTSTKIPTWLQSWRFISEHEARLVLALYILNPEIEKLDLRVLFKNTLRLAGIKSIWAD